MIVAILGAHGFVGRATVAALEADGHDVIPIAAPRLKNEDFTISGKHDDSVDSLRRLLADTEAVVNCAGIAAPSAQLSPDLIGANTLLPALLSQAVLAGGFRRFVHVSSAAVLGDGVLHEQPVDPITCHSPYARTKAAGEREVLDRLGGEATILRPTSVHGPNRSMSQSVASFARTPFSFYCDEAPTPQVLVENVAAAICFILESTSPPPIALQPSEGLTTKTFLEHLGNGHHPRRLPPAPVRASARSMRRLRAPSVIAASRRLEMLAFGQDQQNGTLKRLGFRAPLGQEAWQSLGNHFHTKRH